jgi:hypothetical protein
MMEQERMSLQSSVRSSEPRASESKYRLGRNKEVFDAELFALLRATIMIGDQVEDMISEGVQKIIIFTDSQAALNRIQHNEPGPGQYD